jgi:Zn-dependent peptidase ImmA (M78 family)
MPTFVTVYGRKIPIKYITREKLDTFIPNAEGIWDSYTRTIYICKTAPLKIQMYYIYHEVGHAVMNFTGLDQILPPEIQEVICQSYATVMEDLGSIKARRG